MVGIVQARNNVGNAEQTACHLAAHEVGIVQLGYRRHDVAFIDARLLQRLLVEAHALDGGSIEVAAQVGECVHVAIDHAHVAAVVRQHVGQLRSHAAAAHHDNVAHAKILPEVHATG